MNSTKVGGRIRALRAARKMTVEDLHKLTGLGVDTISRTERGLVRFTLERLELLATALGTTSSALLSETFTVEL